MRLHKPCRLTVTAVTRNAVMQTALESVRYFRLICRSATARPHRTIHPSMSPIHSSLLCRTIPILGMYLNKKLRTTEDDQSARLPVHDIEQYFENRNKGFVLIRSSWVTRLGSRRTSNALAGNSGRLGISATFSKVRAFKMFPLLYSPTLLGSYNFSLINFRYRK